MPTSQSTPPSSQRLQPALLLVDDPALREGHLLTTDAGWGPAACALTRWGIEWAPDLVVDEYGGDVGMVVTSLTVRWPIGPLAAPGAAGPLTLPIHRTAHALLTVGRVMSWSYVAVIGPDDGYEYHRVGLPLTTREYGVLVSVRSGTYGAGWVFGQPSDLESGLEIAAAHGVPAGHVVRTPTGRLDSAWWEGGDLSLAEMAWRESGLRMLSFYWTVESEEQVERE